MNPVLKLHIEKKEFQHAYLLAGDYSSSREMAFEAAKVILRHENLTSHPDFFYEKFEMFGINESHKLSFWASQRPLLGSNKVFVAEIFSFSAESANALLKTFEEPFEGTHFFILAPSVEIIIPTLRSRFVVIENSRGKKEINEETKKLCSEFLKALPSKRMKMAEKISKDKAEAAEFLNGLETVVAKNYKILNNIQKAREFLFDRSPSVKMLMEHIALTLPRM
jgi:DNA polymerase III delta prime subunit